MTSRSRDIVRGVAALLALVGVLFGPPLALAHFVGWPFPTRIPPFDEMATAARSGLDDMVVVKVLAVLAWVVWVQLALAALTEVTAIIRGRAARRAPVLPVVQFGVARLVAVAAVLVAGLSTQRAEPAPIAHLASAVTAPSTQQVTIDEPDAGGIGPNAPLVERRAPADATRVYVVRKNDSWWGIAERTLGDGQRWKELRSLSVGRVMSDGSTIEPTTETIRPGWELVLPAEATAPAPDPSEVGVVAGEVTVQRGDNLWDIAARHLDAAGGEQATEAQVRDHWVEMIEANRDRLADPNNPSLIYSGQRMRLPDVAEGEAPTEPVQPHEAPAEAVPSPPAEIVPSPPAETLPVPTSTAAPSRETAPRATTPVRPAPEAEAPNAIAGTDENERVRVGMLGMASTLLAVGVSGAVWRRRRRRQLEIPAGRRPPEPAPEFDSLRAELAAGADLDHASRLQRSLRDVAVALAERRTEARPRLIQVSGGRVEAFLSQPVVPAPPGWKAEASGSAWVLESEPSSEDDDAPCVSPALVSLGRPDDETELYLDLEAEGVVSVVGDSHAVADIARSWLLELATSPLCAGVSVALVGEGLLSPPAESDRIRVASTWEEIAGDAEAWVEQSAALLAANRWPTPPVGRVRGRRSDDLAPLVLILASRPDDVRFDELCRAIGEHQVAVTVVVLDSEIEGATRVEVEDGALRIPSLSLMCQAQSLTTAVADQVGELLADAAHLPDQLELIPPPSPRQPIVLASDAGEYEDPPHEILVRLLGDISVVGGTKKLKPKQTAVVAFIALHAPVASERVEDALWVAPTSSRRKRLANTVSETRTALGAAHLPSAASDGRYRVGPMVVTDLELFDRRLAYAAQQEDKRAIETLRGALELVEGPVFTYRNADRLSYVWVDVENWHSTWELKVVNAADDLAQRCVDVGDLDGAIWAAQRGLSASKIEPRLTKTLIQAYLAKGDQRAARQVFESHQAALEGLDLDDADPDLVEFYEDACGGRAPAAS